MYFWAFLNALDVSFYDFNCEKSIMEFNSCIFITLDQKMKFQKNYIHPLFHLLFESLSLPYIHS